MEQFTQRVFGLPSREFFPRHADVLVALRHLLVPAALREHAAQLAALADDQLARWPAGRQVRRGLPRRAPTAPTAPPEPP